MVSVGGKWGIVISIIIVHNSYYFSDKIYLAKFEQNG